MASQNEQVDGAVVERLWKSWMDCRTESAKLGREAGSSWARDVAEGIELERLAAWVRSFLDERAFVQVEHTADEVMSVILGGDADDGYLRADFWEKAVGERWEDDVLRPGFLAEFCQGAVSVWNRALLTKSIRTGETPGE
jgi:hypothetical protein